MLPAYDSSNLILYVNMSQVFRLWIIPFYAAKASFTTVLRLRQNQLDQKYYIQSQDDLYQVNEWVRFIWPGGPLLVWLWQTFATLFCLLGAVFFLPVSWFEETGEGRREISGERKKASLVEDPKNIGRLITAPVVLQR